MDYRIWAVLSAVFAGLTAVLSKKGLEDIPSNLALAIRVSFVLAIAWGVAALTKQVRLDSVSHRQLGLLALSAVGTGASWHCYFRALQLGPVSAVAPLDKLSFVVAVILGIIILKERVSIYTGVGAVLIVAGVAVTLMEKKA